MAAGRPRASQPDEARVIAAPTGTGGSVCRFVARVEALAVVAFDGQPAGGCPRGGRAAERLRSRQRSEAGVRAPCHLVQELTRPRAGKPHPVPTPIVSDEQRVNGGWIPCAMSCSPSFDGWPSLAATGIGTWRCAGTCRLSRWHAPPELDVDCGPYPPASGIFVRIAATLATAARSETVSPRAAARSRRGRSPFRADGRPLAPGTQEGARRAEDHQRALPVQRVHVRPSGRGS